jgi:nicotinate dehydrogenase subunit B
VTKCLPRARPIRVRPASRRPNAVEIVERRKVSHAPHIAPKAAAANPLSPVPMANVGGGIAFARYNNRAAYAAVTEEVEVGEEIRVSRAWCAADSGLVINPDGAINQLQGGIVQAASWVLKEQVGLAEAGISSRDPDSYRVSQFSEVPKASVELVNLGIDLPPLGVAEATVFPTAAAIGNAVARAPGARLRDLPLAR